MDATATKLIFVEFTTAKGSKEYFAGESLEAILRDTNGGKDFGGVVYLSHREVKEECVKGLDLELIDRAIHAVRSGSSPSFFLGREDRNN